ncbi:MAG: hypothetical protein KC877_02895 [Candidatus Kaiserbacteria bacterium]|nr:hypothetical protein [Candidatus Kaiserbacteria bacterium]MCB9816736.1 hypothetical protein [Candidatus Nomurabacteria bacterium]
MKNVPRLCYFAAVVVLLFTYFQWDIINIVTPFLIIFVAGPVYIFYLVTLVLSVVYLFKKWKSLKYNAMIPFGASYIALILLTAFPFVEAKIYIDFYVNKYQFNRTVEMVHSGEIYPNTDYNRSMIHLPLGYRHLSKGGGDIEVGENYVFFFTFRGVLDNFSGYVYGHADPKRDLGCDVIDDIDLGNNWKWISCS